ncbi:hypothetical protein [Klebsiella grimontii]|uniref:hypothetical protein n=1 Tax=Klebsiella grimontii TaxID=2058152 RepID=UPI002115AD98|nr:hypothetical protein [Klebsiella grimontii]
MQPTSPAAHYHTYKPSLFPYRLKQVVFTLTSTANIHLNETRNEIEAMNNTERLFSAYHTAKRADFKATSKTITSSLTLLDILANGTAIRVFKECSVSFESGLSPRVVVSVRRSRLKSGWSAVQRIFPISQLETAILYANKMAQKEISRESLAAIA